MVRFGRANALQWCAVSSPSVPRSALCAATNGIRDPFVVVLLLEEFLVTPLYKKNVVDVDPSAVFYDNTSLWRNEEPVYYYS